MMTVEGVAGDQVAAFVKQGSCHKSHLGMLTYQRNVPRYSIALSSDLLARLFGTNFGESNKEEFVSVKILPKGEWSLYMVVGNKSLSHNTCALTPIREVHSYSPSVLIRRVSPRLIDHCVISLPSKEYDQVTTTRDLLSHILAHYKIIQQGSFIPQIKGQIEICEPVEQGLLSPKTMLTVVRDQISAKFNGDISRNETDTGLEFDFANFMNMDLGLDGFDSFKKLGAENKQLHVEPLQFPIDPFTLSPHPHKQQDMEGIALVKIENLAEIGCFSGAWVTIKSTSSKHSRKIKLYAYPEPCTAAGGKIYLSPILWHNIGSSGSVIIFHDPESVSDIELATEVVIARVATPITTDKTYQAAFLSALRTTFESSQRCVREGDLIAVTIDTVLAWNLNSGEQSYQEIMPTGNPNEIAWFKVLSLSNALGRASSECIVDPLSTRIVQSGLLRDRVISTDLGWREYVGLSSLPRFEDKIFPHVAKLARLIRAALFTTQSSLHASILVTSSKRGAGKVSILKSICGKFGIHLFEIDCLDIVGESDAKTLGTLKARFDRASAIFPCMTMLSHIDSFWNDISGEDSVSVGIAEIFSAYLASNKDACILSATASNPDNIPENVRSQFKFEVEVPVPSEKQRREVFRHICVNQINKTSTLTRFELRDVDYTFRLRNDVSLDDMALQSAGLVPKDLWFIMKSAKMKALDRLADAQTDASGIVDLVLCSKGVVKISPADIKAAIDTARSKYSDMIGAPRIPNVTWDDVGGLDSVKGEILDSIDMPLKFPELFADGVKKRSGILFYGPPGTGKTLLAKAIATMFSLNFFSIKGPELLNMYIGESEANVRRVFQRARDARPCVVFFDELDSVAPKRGNQGDSGGVMDRIVSQLLAELDGMSGSDGEGVFVVGATNRPDLLDEALLRPGRFDKMLYLGVPDTHKKQEKVLKALTRKFVVSPDVSLASVAEKCPFTLTGADFYAVTSDAMLNAMIRTAESVDSKIKDYNLEKREKLGLPLISRRWWFDNVADKDDITARVNMEDFNKALGELVPSVSQEEMAHYLSVRRNFESGSSDLPVLDTVTIKGFDYKGKGKGKQRVVDLG